MNQSRGEGGSTGDDRAPKVRSFLEQSPWRDNFRLLSVPRDLATQASGILVQEPVGFD